MTSKFNLRNRAYKLINRTYLKLQGILIAKAENLLNKL